MKNLLQLLRKFVSYIRRDDNTLRNWYMFSNKEYSNKLIFDALISEKPCMIARFGANELNALTNYVSVKNHDIDYPGYVLGKKHAWWWQPAIMKTMHDNAGFFPSNPLTLNRFGELMLQDIKQVDILGSWLTQENLFQKELSHTRKVVLEDLEPFFCNNPWTKALEGKKVLVVHPFAESIESQYARRELLFENNLLPAFELKTLKAVQSIAGEKTPFNDWFEALDYMKKQIDAIDYDICIIGAGAYGFPLAAHVKRTGKKAVHLAGVTQLLFGIRGKRWEEFVVWPYQNLFNEYWVRPSDQEKPRAAGKVEDGCYW
jgi:hypothetical protein